MPRNRRQPKARRPRGLADISLIERTEWSVYGPCIPEDYPSWEEWAKVYECCRQELLDGIEARRQAQLRHPTLARQLEGRPLKTPACERLYQAIKGGADPAVVKAQILRELEENDPRKLLREDMMKRPLERRKEGKA